MLEIYDIYHSYCISHDLSAYQLFIEQILHAWVTAAGLVNSQQFIGG